MNILYSQFKTFNETADRASKSMPTSSKLLFIISAAFVLFTSFFLALFFMATSLLLLPFVAFRLWLFKRKMLKHGDKTTLFSDFINSNRSDNSIIDAEYTVVDSESVKTKYYRT